MSEDLKHTPLYDYYVKNGIKLVDFSQWALPIQFSKIQDEHLAVRNQAGLFETSHMGEIIVKGPDALNWLNSLVTNNLTRLTINQAQYNFVLNEDGFVLDDLLIYKLADDNFLVTPNASNADKIYNWLVSHQADADVEINNISDQIGQLALQGKNATAILQSLVDFDVAELKSFHFLSEQNVGSLDSILISRTGYTGEDGFELYVPWDKTTELFELLLDRGSEYGLIPCGLGARDTLRLEAGLALYGHELSESINPLEADLNFAIKLKKTGGFIGRDALLRYKEAGIKRQLVGFELLSRGLARENILIQDNEGNEIGYVTSGTMVPTQEHAIGMAYIDVDSLDLETIQLVIRNKTVAAKIANKNHL
ncbi:glycine cleavage system aminomethyltransferase GcvT [Fundicoccus culcitae]|uniref:Aminomethyltransferase n=1 Tax=Fundicoccus culcitae TaxID=2969821 RepID=A0ABY5P739_9LACT|nr:glycine cleavage system aminomethyltransferase GcvT [Fundicoccus culcitae]UUX34349.1 glycine cleavage system aminomethyltransferase GcvT [Fundicoccus culcitae]